MKASNSTPDTGIDTMKEKTIDRKRVWCSKWGERKRERLGESTEVMTHDLNHGWWGQGIQTNTFSLQTSGGGYIL